jgi:hypothetical protein
MYNCDILPPEIVESFLVCSHGLHTRWYRDLLDPTTGEYQDLATMLSVSIACTAWTKPLHPILYLLEGAAVHGQHIALIDYIDRAWGIFPKWVEQCLSCGLENVIEWMLSDVVLKRHHWIDGEGELLPGAKMDAVGACILATEHHHEPVLRRLLGLLGHGEWVHGADNQYYEIYCKLSVETI